MKKPEPYAEKTENCIKSIHETFAQISDILNTIKESKLTEKEKYLLYVGILHHTNYASHNIMTEISLINTKQTAETALELARNNIF